MTDDRDSRTEAGNDETDSTVTDATTGGFPVDRDDETGDVLIPAHSGDEVPAVELIGESVTQVRSVENDIEDGALDEPTVNIEVPIGTLPAFAAAMYVGEHAFGRFADNPDVDRRLEHLRHSAVIDAYVNGHDATVAACLDAVSRYGAAAATAGESVEFDAAMYEFSASWELYSTLRSTSRLEREEGVEAVKRVLTRQIRDADSADAGAAVEAAVERVKLLVRKGVLSPQEGSDVLDDAGLEDSSIVEHSKVGGDDMPEFVRADLSDVTSGSGVLMLSPGDDIDEPVSEKTAAWLRENTDMSETLIDVLVGNKSVEDAQAEFVRDIGSSDPDDHPGGGMFR